MKLRGIFASFASMALPALGMLALALIMMPNAQAQCGLPGKLVKPTNWNPQTNGARMVRAALGREDEDDDRPSIVGMWHVVFTAETTTVSGTIPPNGIIDNALVVWHSDHSEIMNSVRPPQDGNFCLGVWEKTGHNEYSLNHFAWFANQYPNSTDNGIGAPVGPTRITERVILADDGKHFSGTFTLTAYDTSGNQTIQFTGTIAGTRVTSTTTVGDLL